MQKEGFDIAYSKSRVVKKANKDKSRANYYNMLSFSYEFKEA